MVDHYLKGVRKKYDDFVKRNEKRRLEDVEKELRELINEIVSTTWRAAGEELEWQSR
ncbi:hypothetical protein [Hydrocarboniclastica marina]|uniref:hypothetical protein n=1 Tax=Hydrocarboniclastica marina TaxID=2259620 RepID=UPI00156208DB|nr:hypothetical protein [Hydrocarboniclastica marina]